MQTFLPYENFNETASVLDWKRLGKQRVEAMQIVNAIVKQTGWRHHPVVHMWTPYVPALKHYTNVMIEEWIKRGYNNTMNLYDVTKDFDGLKDKLFVIDPGFFSSGSVQINGTRIKPW